MTSRAPHPSSKLESQLPSQPRCSRMMASTTFVAAGVAAGQPSGRQLRPPTVLVTRTGVRTEEQQASRQPIATRIDALQES
eukprot:scaffold64618_cov54-Phaeocystis_antarctica.AAC.2